MTVTASYSFQLVQSLDLNFGGGFFGIQAVNTNADVISLANGGFAGLGDNTTNGPAHIDGDIDGSNGVLASGWTNNTGTNGALAQLSDGNIAVVSQDADSVLYKVVNSVNGLNFVNTGDLGLSSGANNETNADVAGLTGGGFVIVDQANYSSTDNDIRVYIRNNNGTAAKTFTVDATTADDQNASVAALDNGSFAVAWSRRPFTGGIQLMYAVYDSNGVAIKLPTMFEFSNNATVFPQNPSVTAINGGFAVAYESASFGDHAEDIALATFNLAGTSQNIYEVGDPNSSAIDPYVTRLPNGMLAVAYTNHVASDRDTIVSLVDPQNGFVLATRNVTGGVSFHDDVTDPAVAGFGPGHIAVFQSDLTTNDINGEDIKAVRTTTGDAADNIIVGDSLIDVISGGAGNDTLTGGAGIDTAIYSGNRASYSITLSGMTTTVTDLRAGSPDGTDTLTSIEKLQFADVTVSLPLPNPPPPAGTTADMILRRPDGTYEIYDIGSNAILGGFALGQVGPEYLFVGLGGFSGTDTTDMILRNSNTGAFEVYDISNNNITGAAALGQVGLEFQVAGFGDFSTRAGETDMMLRNSNTGVFEVYDISNNAITGASAIGQVGLEFQVAGFGDFSGRANESDMLLRNSNTGAFEVYDLVNGQLTTARPMGQVGLEWKVVGFGDFSGNANETDMMMRNVNTGTFELYDIANNAISGANAIGNVGLEWQVAGFGPFNGAGTSDMALRNSNTGAFEVYDIANSNLTTAASLGQVGLEWQLGGFAVDPPSGSSAASNAQLVQATASFGASGALNSAPAASAGIDPSQQVFLATPQQS